MINVVFGAGQVGRWVVSELVARGEEVLVVRRQGGAIPGARVVHLDATGRGATRDVVRGASVVYNCLSAPYHRWTTELPVLWRSVTDAAAEEGARLVVLDNLYMYGAPESPISEHTPERPTSRKGQIRKLLADEILERHHRGDLQAVLARASDFIGPGLDVTAVFSKRNLERLVRDKPVEVLGDASLDHAFSYTPRRRPSACLSRPSSELCVWARLGPSDVACPFALRNDRAARSTLREGLPNHASLPDAAPSPRSLRPHSRGTARDGGGVDQAIRRRRYRGP